MRGHANRIYRRPRLGPDDYRIEDRGFASACWVRRGWLNNKGYGTVRVAGRRMFAHRAMYEQEVGPIPEGHTLDHLCRVRACMNPTHLGPVTMAENLRRGRGAKLTAEDVRVIRREPAAVTTRVLAERYGISQSQMSRVRRGRRWASI